MIKKILITFSAFLAGAIITFIGTAHLSAEIEAQERINGFVKSVGNTIVYLNKFDVENYCFLINQAQRDIANAKDIESWINNLPFQLSPTLNQISIENIQSTVEHLKKLPPKYDYESCK